MSIQAEVTWVISTSPGYEHRCPPRFHSSDTCTQRPSWRTVHHCPVQGMADVSAPSKLDLKIKFWYLNNLQKLFHNFLNESAKNLRNWRPCPSCRFITRNLTDEIKFCLYFLPFKVTILISTSFFANLATDKSFNPSGLPSFVYMIMILTDSNKSTFRFCFQILQSTWQNTKQNRF